MMDASGALNSVGGVRVPRIFQEILEVSADKSERCSCHVTAEVAQCDTANCSHVGVTLATVVQGCSSPEGITTQSALHTASMLYLKANREGSMSYYTFKHWNQAVSNSHCSTKSGWASTRSSNTPLRPTTSARHHTTTRHATCALAGDVAVRGGASRAPPKLIMVGGK